jgi:hypothetical protein
VKLAIEPVWTQRLEKKILCLCRESNLDRPVVARHYTDCATRLDCCVVGDAMPCDRERERERERDKDIIESSQVLAAASMMTAFWDIDLVALFQREPGSADAAFQPGVFSW